MSTDTRTPDKLAAKDAEIADLLAAAKVWHSARRDEISGGVYHYACKALDDAISAHLGLLDREPTAPPTEEEMEHGRETVRQSKAYSEALTFKRERDVARAELEQARDQLAAERDQAQQALNLLYEIRQGKWEPVHVDHAQRTVRAAIRILRALHAAAGEGGAG